MLKELQYPFDANYIISKKKKLRRTLLEQADAGTLMKKKIAVLGGSTTSNICLIMELFLLNQGIAPEFYESEYNQYYEDAMFPNPKLEAFAPDVIYICTSNRNITRYPTLSDQKDDVQQLIDNEMIKFTGMWERLQEVYRCPVIQNNFEQPLYRLMGNKDASDYHGAVNFLTCLNMEFYTYAQEHENFYICDLNYISADYGLRKWADPFYYHMYKYALHVEAIPYLSFNVANMIKSIFGKNKKGLVLDLDNTLWGGVVGDDGVDNLILGPEESEGQVYSEFQKYIKQQKQLGIILNIDSKNDYENAIAGLHHPDSEFVPEDFIEIKANWDPKDQNLKLIAQELNLLPESLVFIDDNPAERHIVAQQLPGVCAPEIGAVQDYIRNIDRNGYFEVTTLSQDDVKRNEMYQENVKRNQLQASFTDYGEYLTSLEMVGEIGTFIPLYMARIAQLTNKSNQFNLTTRRYTQNEIEQVAADAKYITLYGRLCDRFGDNGVVSVVIGHRQKEICHIDLWIMSCRVLKRDMELAMMDSLAEQCIAQGIQRIRGYYYPTAKNKMVRDFYGMLGFTKVSENEQQDTCWELNLAQGYQKKNAHIKVDKE